MTLSTFHGLLCPRCLLGRVKLEEYQRPGLSRWGTELLGLLRYRCSRCRRWFEVREGQLQGATPTQGRA